MFALQRSKLGDLDSPPYNLGRKEDATNLYTYLGSTSIELGKPRSSGRNVRNSADCTSSRGCRPATEQRRSGGGEREREREAGRRAEEEREAGG